MSIWITVCISLRRHVAAMYILLIENILLREYHFCIQNWWVFCMLYNIFYKYFCKSGGRWILLHICVVNQNHLLVIIYLDYESHTKVMPFLGEVSSTWKFSTYLPKCRNVDWINQASASGLNDFPTGHFCVCCRKIKFCLWDCIWHFSDLSILSEFSKKHRFHGMQNLSKPPPST